MIWQNYKNLLILHRTVVNIYQLTLYTEDSVK